MKLKRWFLQGIILTLPILITVVFFYYTILYADAALWFLWDLFPWSLLPWTVAKPTFPGLGLVVVTIFLVTAGALAESWFINSIIKKINDLIDKLPIIRNVYTTILKVAQTTLGSSDTFSNVVLLEYPRKGLYTVGFKTSDVLIPLSDQLQGSKFVSVFIPTTPNPTSGFYILVPEHQVITSNLTTEEAFKLIISAGIVQK